MEISSVRAYVSPPDSHVMRSLEPPAYEDIHNSAIFDEKKLLVLTRSKCATAVMDIQFPRIIYYDPSSSNYEFNYE